MPYFFLFLAVCLGLILQSTGFEALKVSGLKPDPVMLLVIFYAIQQGPRKGGVFGFLAGMLQDFFTAKFLGLNTIIKLVLGFSAGLLEKRVYKENVFVPALLSVVATFAQEGCYIIMRQLAGYLTRADIHFIKYVTVLAIYHFVLAIFGYYLYYSFTEKEIFPAPERRF